MNPGMRSLFFHFNGSRFFSVRIPVCRPCRSRIRLWLAWDHVRTLLIAGTAFAFGITVLLPVLPGWATGLIVLGMCGAGFLGVFVWNMRHPPAFNLDPGPHFVDYEFRNEEVGAEFARLNGAVEAGENP